MGDEPTPDALDQGQADGSGAILSTRPVSMDNRLRSWIPIAISTSTAELPWKLQKSAADLTLMI